jgi:hypothetical protein
LTTKTRAGRLAALVIAAATLGALATAPAQAGPEPYLGWDFGSGVGIGIGTPPSAYDACPTYGWPAYPYRCRYRYYRRYSRYHHHRRR